MHDSIQTTLAITPAWQDLITPGDIVSFRFPLAEEDHSGRPKARPCLVLDIEEHGDQRYALLAYGTTSRRRSNIGYEVHARRRADYLSAGLNEPTRFVGARRLLVPLKHSGFAVCPCCAGEVCVRRRAGPLPLRWVCPLACAPNKVAVLGRLGGAPFNAMNAVRCRINAERDIAADHRSRRGSRTGALRARSFTVERRTPHRVILSGKAVQQ